MRLKGPYRKSFSLSCVLQLNPTPLGVWTEICLFPSDFERWILTFEWWEPHSTMTWVFCNHFWRGGLWPQCKLDGAFKNPWHLCSIQTSLQTLLLAGFWWDGNNPAAPWVNLPIAGGVSQLCPSQLIWHGGKTISIINWNRAWPGLSCWELWAYKSFGKSRRDLCSFMVELSFCLRAAWVLPENYPYLLSLNSSFPGEAEEEVRGWCVYMLGLRGLQGKCWFGKTQGWVSLGFSSWLCPEDLLLLSHPFATFLLDMLRVFPSGKSPLELTPHTPPALR